MSIYAAAALRQPTRYLERLTLRNDGLVAVHAKARNLGEVVTKLITLDGQQLTLNLSTSRRGVSVEIQDAAGQPIPGFDTAEYELNTDDFKRQKSSNTCST